MVYKGIGGVVINFDVVSHKLSDGVSQVNLLPSFLVCCVSKTE